jgi:uncharacterized protein (TIGR02145 family)
MKKKHLLFAFIFPVLLTGCIYDCITDPPQSGTTITITADLPGNTASTSGNVAGTPNITASPSGNNTDVPNTRIALTQDDLDVDLTWETGDQLYLCVVYGGAKQKQTVIVTVDDENSKRATFSITLPEGDYTTFDLYGVYGGGGLSATEGEEHLALLPTAAQSVSSSLDAIQESKAVMLKFAKTGISKASPNLSVNFEHMGSLFRILFKNTVGSTLNNITAAQLAAVSDIPAYPNAGGATYNLIDGTFSGSQGTSLSFAPISSSNVVSGGILAFWAWFPVDKGGGTGADWPALNLTVNPQGGDHTTGSSKAARKATTGKAYYLYATDNGTTLSFAASGDMTIAEGKLADTRDGNLYNTVTIDTQIWMAENLKYLPAVVGQRTGSEDAGHETTHYYYVYGYNDTDVATAKASANYQTYGVLYNNWAATESACPSGWHLPFDMEWTQLTNYLEGEGVAGDKMKETGTTHWPSPNTGATNESGFTALPGGFRGIEGIFDSIGDLGYWWSSSQRYPSNTVWYRELYYYGSGIDRYYIDKDYGFSVRCVRD